MCAYALSELNSNQMRGGLVAIATAPWKPPHASMAKKRGRHAPYLGAYIKKARMPDGTRMTRQKLADQIGVGMTGQQVSRYVKNKQGMSDEVVRDICKALRITEHELFYIDPTVPRAPLPAILSQPDIARDKEAGPSAESSKPLDKAEAETSDNSSGFGVAMGEVVDFAALRGGTGQGDQASFLEAIAKLLQRLTEQNQALIDGQETAARTTEALAELIRQERTERWRLESAVNSLGIAFHEFRTSEEKRRAG